MPWPPALNPFCAAIVPAMLVRSAWVAGGTVTVLGRLNMLSTSRRRNRRTLPATTPMGAGPSPTLPGIGLASKSARHAVALSESDVENVTNW